MDTPKKADTVFKQYERIVQEVVTKLYKQKHKSARHTSFAQRALSFVKSASIDLEDIHPELSEDGKNTLESQSFTLVVFILRIALPLEALRSICVMPPEGCPLERWVCCAGPCRSSNTWKSQRLDTVKVLRPQFGLQDDLPEEFYERFEQFWGHLKRRSGIIGLNNPLMLFPVKELEPIVKETIVKRNQDLADITDSLFVCVDHFKNAFPGRKVIDKRYLNNYSIENINSLLKDKKVNFKLPSGSKYRKIFIEKLTDGYMLDLQMSTDIVGRSLSLAGVSDRVELVLSQMDQGMSGDMSQRYLNDSSSPNCFNPMQYQRGYSTEQTNSGYQNQE